MNNPALADAAKLIGRILLALMFVLAGWSKISGYAGTQAYMGSAGVPAILLPLVIVVELIGGLMIVVGYKTRLAALVLFAFTIAASVLFHMNWAAPMQQQIFLKNLAVAGGFLVLFAAGAGRYSVDKD
ncbi:DoxX family protein [Bosea vestrisii]|uniref:DoxX family protein n=1 Tax=Bosea vestrisii TaxID=151416 RepID=UPI0024DFE93E|nr:DoxX family protein [Bosea vestrisii]WID95898.1 DoxX family protein [Bosea vestrisii]